MVTARHVSQAEPPLETMQPAVPMQMPVQSMQPMQPMRLDHRWVMHGDTSAPQNILDRHDYIYIYYIGIDIDMDMDMDIYIYR
jgi:hypothetical protein